MTDLKLLRAECASDAGPATGVQGWTIRAVFGHDGTHEGAAATSALLARVRATQVRVLDSSGRVLSADGGLTIAAPTPDAGFLIRPGHRARELVVHIPISLRAAARPPTADPPVLLLQFVGVSGLPPGRSWVGFVLGDPNAHGRSPPPADPVAPSPPSPPPLAPTIDYLARDYEGLTSVMLGRLAVNLPSDAATGLEHPADPLRTIVEALAAAGDYLSYSQDAIATEAYLNSARWRLSVRRHARLFDYQLHDGCNARTWLAVQVAQDLLLPAGTCAVSGQPASTLTQLPPDFAALAPASTVFQTMETVRLSADLSDLGPDLQRPAAYVIPQGSCWIQLQGAHTDLKPGRVLVFAQTDPAVASPSFGAHAVRVVYAGVLPRPGGAATAQDPTQDTSMTVVLWHPEDAMPRPFTVPASGDPGIALYGNAVLADHGRPMSVPSRTPLDVGGDSTSRTLTLAVDDLTFAAPAPSIPAAFHAVTRTLSPSEAAGLLPSATACLQPDPAEAAAQITLFDDRGGAWTAWRDLLVANPLTLAFTPDIARGFGEPNSSPQRAERTLRFGDGVLGRAPGADMTFAVRWRSGNGVAGNVGAGVLNQIIVDAPPGAILAVSNPVAATGGAPPAPTRYGSLMAPTAYRRQLRGATAADLRDLALRHPLVIDANVSAGDVGFKVWVNVRPPAEMSLPAVARYLERFEVTGAPVQVAPPKVVGADIALTVYVRPQASIGAVRARLSRDFGTGAAWNGGPAFFNPARLRLGQPVTLADLVSVAMADLDVAYVETDPQSDPRLKFRIWSPDSEEKRGDFDAGVLTVNPGEIVRADNDPLRPSRGRIELYVAAEP